MELKIMKLFLLNTIGN
jgi:hypothetical protein